MNHFILLIIVPFFTIMINGPELCFDNDGDIHLTCCCKNEISIKKPCCGPDCSKVKIEVSDMLNRAPSTAIVIESSDSNDNFTYSTNSFVSHGKFYYDQHAAASKKHSRAPDIPRILSTIILRC